jgi:phosphoribosylamine---glycine ligase
MIFMPDADEAKIARGRDGKLKLRVLFISGELIAADLAYRLKEEGCEVKLYIQDRSRRDCLEGLVEKTENWKKELKWVGKDGLIVFDDVGYGKIQDDLRKKGYLVVGGSEGGDRLEKERAYAQKILSTCEIKTVPTYDFDEIESAFKFVKKKGGLWVVKQNNHASALTYVGTMPDGSDTLEVLESYENYATDLRSVSLQKKVEGIEIAAGRYFNGNDWVGPIEMNIEHKRLCNGDIGPLTGEMGTLTWYDDNDNNRLFQETLEKLKPFLKKIDFRGDLDINCIVNKERAFPLEVTARFGCPSTQLQAEIHLSPWKDFLSAIAKGESFDLKYKRGFGIVVSIAVPPFPYKSISSDYYLKGANILFKSKLSKEEFDRLHFEEVILKQGLKGKKYFQIAGSNGYILYVTGFGKTIAEAQNQAYSLIDKIVIPKMFYRTDIGVKFQKNDQKLLKEWGWI